MGWLFIIMGVVLIALALAFMSQRERHTVKVSKPKPEPKPIQIHQPKPIKTAPPAQKVIEKSVKPEQETIAPELSQDDIKRIQKRGLNYLKRD